MSTCKGISGNGVQSIPAWSRKMVQSLKEIVSCSETEIYATLKDCNMDPNEAVNRLLTQDPFREVKSKREKKKENKDTTESRSRGASNNSNRGSKSGADRSLWSGGSTPYNSYESGPLHGKGTYKKETGSNSYPNTSTSASVTAGSFTNRQPPPVRDVAIEYKASSADAAYGVSSGLQPQGGYTPAWVGVPGQVSMADIVKMGRPQASSARNVGNNGNSPHFQGHSSTTTNHNSSRDTSAIDEWPSIERPAAAAKMHSVSEPLVESGLHSDAPNLPFDMIGQPSQTEEVWKAEDDNIENFGTNDMGSTSISSRNLPEDNSGGASRFEDSLYNNMDSYQPHGHSLENQEVEEVGVSVSSVTANLHELSLQQEDHGLPGDGDGPSVVIADHIQVQTADCSHLSFGSFGSGMNAVFPSGHSVSTAVKTSLDEAHGEADVPAVDHSDSRNSEYFGDDSMKNAPDGNLFDRTGESSGSYDASQTDEFKPVNIEIAHGNQYAFPTSNPDYTFDSAQRLNAAYGQSQTSSEIQNLTPFSSAMTYTNSLPSTLLAANVHSGRDSDLQYSPFPVTLSLPTKFLNPASSIGGSSISIPDALKTSGFTSTLPTPESLSGTSVATGPPLPQHLPVHPYSQSSLPLGPYANMVGYPFLPQSYPYMPSAFQQQFAGNNAYHQSLAAVHPQFKSSVSVSSLPQSAAVGAGYGGFGSTTTVPGSFLMNPPAPPSGTNLSYDDVLSSQYKDSSHLISLQQNENSGMWLHGPNSRAVSGMPASTYYNSYQGQNQQTGGFKQGQQPSQSYGALSYPNFYHSQTGDHQQPSLRDGSLGGPQRQPKQPQQIWQNSY